MLTKWRAEERRTVPHRHFESHFPQTRSQLSTFYFCHSTILLQNREKECNLFRWISGRSMETENGNWKCVFVRRRLLTGSESIFWSLQFRYLMAFDGHKIMHSIEINNVQWQLSKSFCLHTHVLNVMRRNKFSIFMHKCDDGRMCCNNDMHVSIRRRIYSSVAFIGRTTHRSYIRAIEPVLC